MAKTSSPNYTLSGQITNRQGEPLPELTVRAYDQDTKSRDDFVGEATTDQGWALPHPLQRGPVQTRRQGAW